MKISGTTLDFLRKSSGNILEWYDFSLYVVFAGAISHAFFPMKDPFLELLAVFSTFGVSFVARPLGSILFGYIGDQWGKTFSINISVWCMAIPTVLVGLLPTYQQIGAIAPLLLVISRLLQGLSVGGQISGLISVAAEAEKGGRSFLVSTILSVSVLGNLLAIWIGFISVSTIGLFSKELEWRVPFILSGLFFALYLKLKPEHKKNERTDKQFKFRKIFERQSQEFLYMTVLSSVMASIYYVLFVYFVTYLELHLETSKFISFMAMTMLFLVSLGCYLLAGKLADKSLDRIKASKKFTLFFCCGAIMLSLHNSVQWVVLCFTVMAIAYCFIASYLTTMFAEIFEEEYRMTACSLCYSCGAIFGGSSPVMSHLLASKSYGGFFMFLLCLGFGLYLTQDKILDTKGYRKFVSI